MMLKEIVVERMFRNINIPSVIIVMGTAMMMSYSSICGIPSPLNCALTAVLPPIYSVVVLAGSILTYFLSGNISEYAMIICSLIMITVGRWIVREDYSPILSGVITASCFGLTGIIFGLFIENSFSATVMNIIFAVAAGLTVFFLHNAGLFFFGERPLRLDRKSELSVAAVYMLAITALCSMGIAVINLGRIIGTAVVLCAAKRFKSSGGVIFGVLTTAGIFLSSADLGIPSVFLGIAGFAAGFAAGHSRISIAALFLTINFGGQFITGMNDASFLLQADVIIGSIAFMFIPEKIIMYGQIIRETDDDGSGQLVKMRMDFVAGTLIDVKKNMEDIIKRLEKNIVPFNTVNEVSNRVCSKCRNKVRCWERNYEKINSAFLKFEKQTNVGESFPGALDHCIRKFEIAEAFTRCRKEDAVNKMLSARLNESRSILFSQMEATEGILASLSDKMNFSYSKSLTQSLCSLLNDTGVYYTNAIAYFNRNQRLIAEIYVKDELEISTEELSQMLSKEFHIPMEAAEPVSCGNETRFRFSRKPKYSVEFAADQKSACENQPSGDSCGFFEDGLGYAYIFISDGMGSGRQAALDSAIVSRIFKRLIKSGIECDCAVKMLNSIMLTKSGEESFATLDIARIDLETCELTLFKSGASSTLIKYDDSVMMFNSPSNPIGIIPDSQIFTRTCDFNAGNVLVMLSDGVDESLYLYIKEQLLNIGELKVITENVCASADKKSKSVLKDDITVAALRLEMRV